MTSYWNDLIRSALVGTNNRPYQLQSQGDTLGDMLDKISTAQPDSTRLLMATAILTNYERVGHLPPQPEKPKLWTSAEADDTPELPPDVNELLWALRPSNNFDERTTLFEEWLHYALQTGHRIPDALLPDALDAIRLQFENKLIPQSLNTLVGQRGLWLASLRNRWGFLLWETDFTYAWHVTVSASRRKGLFRQYRQADPKAAREFLIEKRNKFNNSTLAQYVNWMTIGLSLDDEPFLNELMTSDDDGLRKAARELLQTLRGSAYVNRMCERVAKHITLGRKGFTIESVEMTKQARRDGLHSVRRGEWSQIVPSVPPSFWCEHFNISPEKAIRLSERHDKQLYEYWPHALQNHPDEEWSRVFVDYHIRTKNYPALGWSALGLPDDEREKLAIDLIQNKHINLFDIQKMLPKHQWSQELTDVFVEAFRNHPYHKQKRTNLAQLLYSVTHVVHPADIRPMGELIEMTREHSRFYVSGINNMADTLTYRHDMWHAFQPLIQQHQQEIE